MAKKEKLLVNFPPKTLIEVSKLSDETGVSMSGIVSSIVQTHFNPELDFNSLLAGCNPPRKDLQTRIRTVRAEDEQENAQEENVVPIAGQESNTA